MSKFIEVTVILVRSDGFQKLEKMLVNSDSISIIEDDGKSRTLCFKDDSFLNVKESYEELKDMLIG